MNKSIRLILIVIFTMIFTYGCAENAGNPVIQKPYQIPDEVLSSFQTRDAERTLLGCWIARFNVSIPDVTVHDYRLNHAHFNVTQYIPPPQIVINSYDPMGVIDVDVKLTNPYPIDVYDVRLIIFTDDAFHRLLNPDCWTNLWDIPGGGPINPFAAYAKNNPKRKFNAQSYQTENLQIYLPNGNTNVLFAVDSSYPGNCLEPYDINNFTQEILYDQQGEEANIEVTIHDWQNDVNAVYLFCPQITGQPLISLEHSGNEKWSSTIINNTGVAEGEYVGYIIAKSLNSGSLALFDDVIISVSSGFGIPDNPKIVGNIFTMEDCVDVTANGDYIYCSCEGEGICIFEIDEEANIIPISKLKTDFAKNAVTNGDYLYLADGSSGIKVIDISNPREPAIVNIIDTNYARKIVISGEYMYLGDSYGLIIFDISNPVNPIVIPNSLGLGAILDIKVEDYIIFLLSYDYSHYNFQIINVSDPANPLIIYTVGLSYANTIDVENDFAYLVGYSPRKLKILNIADPSSPVETGSMDVPNCTDIDVRGNYAYLTVDNTMSDISLKILDVHDPSSPAVIGSIDMTEPCSVTAIQNYAFVADGQDGMKIVDVSDSAQPVLRNTYYINQVQDVFVRDNMAFVACRKGGLQIADISNISYPKVVGVYDGWYVDIVSCWVSGNIAYAMCVTEMLILDVSIPEKPEFLSYVDVESAWNVYIRDNLAYIPDEWNGLKIVDISDPENPVVLNSDPFISHPHNLVLDGNYAYIASSSSGWNAFQVVDVSNPTNLIKVGFFESYKARGIDKKENLIFLAHYDINMFHIIDVTVPNAPVLTGIAYTDHQAVDVDIQGHYAYVSGFKPAGGGGLEIVDVADPTNPILFSSLTTDGHSCNITVEGRYAYLADMDGGLKIILLW